MSGAALRNLDQSHRRRSPRLKDIHVVYSEDRETYFCPLKYIKTEIIDPEEAAFPSTSEFNVACVADNDVEQDLHNVTLKDLRARCKAKNLKTEKIASEGHDIMNQTQSGNLENVKSDEEVDLDEPLIALKQKRQKISPSKAKENMDVPTSPHPAKIEDTISKGDMTSHIQTFSLDATLHDSATAKLGRRAMDLEHSEIEVIIDRRVEMVGDDICSAETEKRTCCKIEAEAHKEALVSSYCEKNSFEHSAVVLHQLPVEDDGCGQQPDFITQPTELNVSDHLCGLTHRVEAYLDDNVVQNKITNIVSSSECIDERSNHRKPLDISNSDVDTSSTGSELSLSSVNQSCEDYIDNDEYCYPEHVEANTPENVKAVEESCPIDEFNTETGSRSIVMQPDSCGSIERNCTSLEVGQMQADDQLGSVVCHSVITKGILLHMNVDQAATDNNCPFDKTIDLAHTANFFTQDGRLESIVFDALNNHVQRKSSETKRIVGVSDTTVILSPLIEANAALDSQLLFANGKEGSSKDMNQLKCAMNGDIRRSVNDQVSGEEIGFQHQLFQACVDMDKSAGVISESSSAPKETQELPAGASDSTVTRQETNAQSKKSEFFIDEVSVEEHTPKKLLSKRKIMSPTSQEKLCNALTGIDLHGVERPNCDEIRQTLPQTTNMHGQPVLSRDRKIKDKTSLTCASKGVLKSTESQSSQQMACTCMRSSSVLLGPRKAVEFSERQMHDIENIAANLIRSLKHMRSIVDESLSSELLALLPNSNSAQIRAASEDALEVERTTRKWLAIMNKDCNRFCKILTLEGGNAISHSEVLRKRRKITFADEAGGTLCHVKVFSDGQTSLLSECQGEL